jgi:hypothetical protein
MAIQIFSGAFSQGYSTSCGQFFENPNLLPFFAQGPLVRDVKYRCLVSIYVHGETKLFVGFCDEAPEMFLDSGIQKIASDMFSGGRARLHVTSV